MKKLFYLLAAFCAVLSFASCATDEAELTGDIFGRITDSKSGEPVSSVTVTLTPGGKSTITGVDGTFLYSGVTPGQYSLQAQKEGYNTNYKQIAIVAGETASGDMALTRAAVSQNVEISPSELLFGNDITEQYFTIKNVGHAGDISWNIAGLDVDWMTVAPKSGTTGLGNTSIVKVTVDRTGLTETVSSIITINLPGGSEAVRVTVNPN